MMEIITIYNNELSEHDKELNHFFSLGWELYGNLIFDKIEIEGKSYKIFIQQIIKK